MTEKLGVLAWGIHIQDLTRTTMNWNTKWKDTVPVNIRWGISYQHSILEADHVIRISYDHESRWRGKNRLGFEYKGYNLFGLRAGIDESKFSGGAGFQFWKINIDYAYLSNELGPLHRIGCSLSF
jgi:hypothetical protein